MNFAANLGVSLSLFYAKSRPWRAGFLVCTFYMCQRSLRNFEFHTKGWSAFLSGFEDHFVKFCLLVPNQLQNVENSVSEIQRSRNERTVLAASGRDKRAIRHKPLRFSVEIDQLRSFISHLFTSSHSPFLKMQGRLILPRIICDFNP